MSVIILYPCVYRLPFKFFIHIFRKRKKQMFFCDVTKGFLSEFSTGVLLKSWRSVTAMVGVQKASINRQPGSDTPAKVPVDKVR